MDTQNIMFMDLPVKCYILPGVCVCLHECVRTQQHNNNTVGTRYLVLATAVCTYCVKSRKTTTICTRLFSSTSTVVLTLSCLIIVRNQSQKCFAKYRYFHLPLPFPSLTAVFQHNFSSLLFAYFGKKFLFVVLVRNDCIVSWFPTCWADVPIV